MFDNKGYVSLSGTNWKIFLYSFFVIEADHILSGNGNFMLSEGYVLKEFNMSTRQIQGSLFFCHFHLYILHILFETISGRWPALRDIINII
jgi:hypothetical protein